MVNWGFSDSRCPIRIGLSAPKHSESCHVSLSILNDVMMLSNEDIPKTARKIFDRRVYLHVLSLKVIFELLTLCSFSKASSRAQLSYDNEFFACK